MIATLLAAAVALGPTAVLAKYAAALAQLHTPRVLTFDYTLEQTGVQNGEQQHRILRDGDDERDELLVVDGKRLSPPAVRIVRGRRNRYTAEGLAPRPDVYSFGFFGTRRSGAHLDYVFTTALRSNAAFRVTSVTIDGVSFAPVEIAFATRDHGGRGRVSFARVAGAWVPTAAFARADYAGSPATERIAFSGYHFPRSLPATTFAQAKAAVPEP